MKKNTWIPNQIRRDVAIRDRGVCHWCEKKALTVKLDQWGIPRFYDENKIAYEHDHLIPEEKGGKTKLKNVVLSCRKCNRTRKRLPDDKTNEIKELIDEWK